MNSITSKVVLLLTPLDMGKDGAGQLYLKALISSTPSIQVVTIRFPEVEYLEYLPLSRGGWISRVLKSLLSRFGLWQTLRVALYERVYLSRDVKRAKGLFQYHRAESCWITLSSPECILLAHSLVKNNLKLRVTVWDVPEHLLSSLKISSIAAERLMSIFAKVMCGAASVSVIGTNMQEYYQSLFGINAVVIRPISSIPPDREKVIPKSGKLRIVFAGSLYAKNEWNALLKSLIAQNWCIANRKVVIYFVGAFPLYGAAWNKNVRKLGYIPAKQVVEICRTCDIAYLPYWLTKDKNVVATTSFPSKLALYLSCGLPVLNHGPRFSELTRIMNNYQIGISCHSLDAVDIKTSLEALIVIADKLSTRQSILNLVQVELSLESVGKRFVEFINS